MPAFGTRRPRCRRFIATLPRPLRYAPPYWVKGEDSAFGFFVHVSPFAKLTPLHWGWNVVHDGWVRAEIFAEIFAEIHGLSAASPSAQEYRSPAERGLCTQNISSRTIVVHSMHTVGDFERARAQLRERCDACNCSHRHHHNSTHHHHHSTRHNNGVHNNRCDAACQRTIEPFEVTGLRDLCSRNPRIPKVYAKCEAAGHPPATEHAKLARPPMARPDCHSVGANVPFIASVEDGGTITCK